MRSEKYFTTIGLEIHAELKTETKMFCDSKNDPDEEKPNVNICPVCMGHPGTLPVINKEAVKHVLKVGVALGGKIADFTEFDRKNYFYPDIPKGYQISQYKYPLISGGILNGVELTRIHLEEDTATSRHEEGDFSLVDFNRAGVPLMELVTEPVIHSAKEAADFARELQLLLRYLAVSDANMEKGEMRVEANISISQDPKKFGTKVEVKNLNSFKAVEKAIEYEVTRHIELLESGKSIVQETRGFDETTGKTFSQRSKEDSHDYRYFPDPDLPKLYISKIPEFSAENLKKEMPELPTDKRKRFADELKLKIEDVETFITNPHIAAFFEDVLKNIETYTEVHVRLAANYILSDLSGLMKSLDVKHFGELTAESFAKIIKMINANLLSSRGAKDLLVHIFKEGGEPEKIAEQKGLIQKNDPEALKPVLKKIIENNPSVVGEYKAGKQSAINSLIGQAMKETKGAGNPQILRELLETLLSK